jgi:hypothetical protein
MTDRIEKKWCVVGAGVGGISAIATLLDNKVSPFDIIWVDPLFDVGHMGLYWTSVSGNTPVRLLEAFLNASPNFQYSKLRANFKLKDLDPNSTCDLIDVIEILRIISGNLTGMVDCLRDTVLKIDRANKWTVTTNNSTVIADKIILAPGAESIKPNTLILPKNNIEIIPQEIALQKHILKSIVLGSDKVAVFGSSHSAILVIKQLCEMNVPVINFWRSGLLYHESLPEGEKNMFTGLKGIAKQWSLDNLEQTKNKLVTRFESTEENINLHIQRCTKAIYCIGFKSVGIPVFGIDSLKYDKDGVIDSNGIYGIGIAYPEVGFDFEGKFERRIGFQMFLHTLQEKYKIWAK